MNENQYRTGKLIILGVFVVGALVIGGRISQSVEQASENGRYLQLDRMKDIVTTGDSTRGYPTYLIDTRSGTILPSDQIAK